MTIYATPFKASTKQCSGPSTDSGFENLDDVVAAMGPDYVARYKAMVIYGPGDDVVAAMGPDYVARYKAMVIYGPGEDRVVFSKIIFCIDDTGTTG